MKRFWFMFVPDDLTCCVHVYVCDSYLSGSCSWGLFSSQNSPPHKPCECDCCLFERLLYFWCRRAEASHQHLCSLCSTSEKGFSVSYIILKLKEMWVPVFVVCQGNVPAADHFLHSAHDSERVAEGRHSIYHSGNTLTFSSVHMTLQSTWCVFSSETIGDAFGATERHTCGWTLRWPCGRRGSSSRPCLGGDTLCVHPSVVFM